MLTGLPLVCLITFALIISLINKLKTHFLVIFFSLSIQCCGLLALKYFAYDQILVLVYFRLMWITRTYEDSARPSQ
jgi:hypothetical protein